MRQSQVFIPSLDPSTKYYPVVEVSDFIRISDSVHTLAIVYSIPAYKPGDYSSTKVLYCPYEVFADFFAPYQKTSDRTGNTYYDKSLIQQNNVKIRVDAQYSPSYSFEDPS